MKFVDLSNFGTGFLSFLEDIIKFDKSFDKYTKTFYEKFKKYEEKLDERNRQPDALAYNFRQLNENLKKYDNEFDENEVNNENEVNKYSENYAIYKKGLLSYAGFKEDEIKSFSDWIIMNDGFKKAILDAIIDFIIYRYNIYLYEFKPNEKAKDLLEKFVKDKLAFYMNKKIELTIDKSQIIDDKDDDNKIIKEYSLRNFKYEFYDMCNPNLEEISLFIYIYLSNRFIIKDLKDLVKSLTSIVGIEKEYFDSKIRSCDREMKMSWLTERDKENYNNKKHLFEIYRNEILTDV